MAAGDMAAAEVRVCQTFAELVAKRASQSDTFLEQRRGIRVTSRGAP
jgi:hypothetical protein